MTSEDHGRQAHATPILAARNLTLRYRRKSLLGRQTSEVTALQDVSLNLFAGKTVALIGPSGSGKSSLARCLVLLEQPDSGEIWYEGKDLLKQNAQERKESLRAIQIVFQDSAAALNPGFTVEEILDEPLVVHRIARSSVEKAGGLRELLRQVELSEGILKRRPLELSGGQRQRVAIARALALEPKILILDEALSALDLSTQGQIANLLLELQEKRDLAYLYITHDVSLAVLLADEFAEIAEGRIIGTGLKLNGLTGNLHGGAKRLPLGSSSSETVPVR
jgi:ABC-type glutathione transport system ATPase component